MAFDPNDLLPEEEREEGRRRPPWGPGYEGGPPYPVEAPAEAPGEEGEATPPTPAPPTPVEVIGAEWLSPGDLVQLFTYLFHFYYPRTITISLGPRKMTIEV